MLIRLLVFLSIAVLAVSLENNAIEEYELSPKQTIDNLNNFRKSQEVQTVLKALKTVNSFATKIPVPEIIIVAYGIEFLLDAAIVPDKTSEQIIMDKIAEVFADLNRAMSSSNEEQNCHHAWFVDYHYTHHNASEWSARVKTLIDNRALGSARMFQACKYESQADHILTLKGIADNLSGQYSFASQCFKANGYSNAAMKDIRRIISADTSMGVLQAILCSDITGKKPDEANIMKYLTTIGQYYIKLQELYEKHEFEAIEAQAKKFLSNSKNTLLTTAKALQMFEDEFHPNWCTHNQTTFNVMFFNNNEESLPKFASKTNPNFKNNILTLDSNPKWTVQFFKTNITSSLTVSHLKAFKSLNGIDAFLNKKIAESKDKKFYQFSKIRLNTTEIVDHIYGMYPFPYVSATVVATKDSLGVHIDEGAGSSIVKDFDCKMKKMNDHNGKCFLAVSIGF